MMEANNIYLGDAYKLIKELPSNSIDLIITDPPYEYDELSGRGIGGQMELYKEIRDLSIDKGFDFKIIDEFIRVLKNPNFYIFVSKKQFFKLANYCFEKYPFLKWDLILWKKLNAPPLCSNQYLHDVEYCLYFHHNVRLKTKYKNAETVYISALNQADKKLYEHPTIKPLQLIIKTIEISSSEGMVVLDPFLGSGTTAEAAKITGRKYIGFEISEKYKKIAVDRLEGVTKTQRKNKIKQLSLFDDYIDENK